MTEQASNIEKILHDLNLRSNQIEASSVVTRDGITVASALEPGVDPDRVSAMCASLLGLADTAANELDRGWLKLVLLQGEYGVLLLVQAGPDHVLAVSATSDIRLGTVLVEAKQTASRILENLKG